MPPNNDDEEELYDEFGNYIGPDLDDDEDGESSVEEGGDGQPADDDAASDVSEQVGDQAITIAEDTAATTADPMSAIVLHEDKEHYPSAEQVFGEEVRTAVLDEDAMEIETPLVQPATTQTIHHTPKGSSKKGSDMWTYSDDYLQVQLSNETTRTRRGLAVIGHFHHGKTSLIDLLLEPTLHQAGGWGKLVSLDVSNGGGPRYTDTLQTERQRQMSLASTPLTALLNDDRGKSYCFTLIDCPGHVNFHDETVAALKCADGALVVVDAVEGVLMHTEMAIRHAVLQEGLPLVLCITKMDRLLVELKLPPNDCYYKLQHVIDSVNELVQQVSQGRYPKLCPSRGNVVFSSAQHGWMFTLESFANVYLEQQSTSLGENLSARDLAKRLWGDAYLDPVDGTFHKSQHDCPSRQRRRMDNEDDDDVEIDRTFVTLVLNPLYKIYAACLAERPEPTVHDLLRKLGVFLSRDELRASARPLLRSAFTQFLASARGGLVQAVVRHVPCPAVAAKSKLVRCYTGPQDTASRRLEAMRECDPNGPLVIHAVKQYYSAATSSEDGGGEGPFFLTLGRIYSGTIRPQMPVQILGESYSPDEDDEDVATATVQAILIPRGPPSSHLPVHQAKAGNWVLLQGLEDHIHKTATIINVPDSGTEDEDCHIFAPLSFPQAGGEAVMKLAMEPLQPAELPKMVQGLRRLSKAYPLLQTRVEESGEHVVLGTGELYLDCVLHDLRKHDMGGGASAATAINDVSLEVKVADPVVSFRETVVDTSSLKCFAETANKRNRLEFIAEPMEDGLAELLEGGKVKRHVWDLKKTGRFFQERYQWDILSSRSIWAFGDHATRGPNILLNDTLPSDIDASLLNTCRSSIVQGFQWAMREGPLCEEPVRGTKLKLLNATLADKPIYRGGGQVIPTARRTVHSALLTATPRLMEPVYRVQMQCANPATVEAVGPVLARRRGHVVQDRPLPGTTLFLVQGFVPVLDSFGLETDLRTFTQGQAMMHAVLDHWAVVPGDPLDRSLVLHPLEPSPPHCLARELLLKTRRRKGLAEDVTVSQFLDPAMREQLLATEQQQGEPGGSMDMAEVATSKL